MTPIGIVYDCSVRKGKNGLSLNDCLSMGPLMTADLFKVLLKFRTRSFACISDIEKALLMVQQSLVGDGYRKNIQSSNLSKILMAKVCC